MRGIPVIHRQIQFFDVKIYMLAVTINAKMPERAESLLKPHPGAANGLQ